MTSKTRERRTGLIVAALGLTGVIAAGMQTLVIPLIGQMPTILGTSAANASWAVTATLLTSAVAVPLAGRLGDMYGKRRILMLSILPLVAGSIVCAVAGSVVPMIAGRGLQGLGMGVVPLGISLLREVVPPERIGSAVAMMSASMGIGGAIGLPVAAAVAQTSSWRMMFWTFGVLAALMLVLVWRWVPDGYRGVRGTRFDARGAVGLAVGLVSLLLAVSQGSTWGWLDAKTIGFALLALATLAVWARHQLRTEQPLVNLRSLAHRPVAVTNIASLLVAFAMYAQSLAVPQLLQLPVSSGYGHGQSMLAMALWLAPGGLVMMAVAPLGARLSAARGPRVTLALGALAIAASYAASLVLMGSAAGLMIVVVICNVGVALAYGATPLLIMGGVPRSESGAANSFNTLVRSIGTTLAAAGIGALLAQMSTAADGHLVPTEGAFRLVMVVGCALSLVAAAVAARIPVGAGHQDLAEEDEDAAPEPEPALT